MKIQNVIFADRFVKRIKKLTPNERELYVKKYEWFVHESHDPRLKTHSLRGKLSGTLAFSVNYSIRVIFRFLSEDSVLFIDIGTHEVYK